MSDQNLPGSKWRRTHQYTIDAILGADPASETHRKVVSEGVEFYNEDTWYVRTFTSAFCEWARYNRGGDPSRWDILDMISKSEYRCGGVTKRIVIAQTPDDLSPSLAMALVGGGCHEAWHTLYSRRKPLVLEDVMGKLTELWGKIPYDPEAGHRGWARLSNSLLAWSNIIEDIRIERLGVKEFPGTLQKLEAVADLILGRERDSLKEAQGTIDPLQLEAAVVMGAFRDLGKGYQTSLQLATLENYAKTSPKGWALVNEGALRPLVERAIALGKDDGLGSLWLAMEVLIVLSEEIAAENLRLEQKKKEQEKKEQEKAKKEQEKAKKEQEKKEKESKNKKKEQGKKPNPQQAEATGEDNELPEKDEGASDAGGKPPIFKVGDVVMADGRKAKVVRAGLPDPVSGVQELELELLPE